MGTGAGTGSAVPMTLGDATSPPCHPQHGRPAGHPWPWDGAGEVLPDPLPVIPTERDESLGAGGAGDTSLASSWEDARPSPSPAHIPGGLLCTGTPPEGRGDGSDTAPEKHSLLPHQSPCAAPEMPPPPWLPLVPCGQVGGGGALS